MLKELKTHSYKSEDIVVSDTEDDYSNFKLDKKSPKKKAAAPKETKSCRCNIF